MSIRIENVAKQFGSYTALDGVSLEVASGELLALLGPSGCGKTTLLRIIAGLETPGAGRIFLDDEDSTGTAANKKNVGFVFQHYALFPHLTVFENVAFGLRVQRGPEKPGRAEIRERVLELLSMVQMDWAARRMPAQLSGGQRQRVALARALAVKPRVLLLDEPFSALDAKVRLELRRWLRKLHEEIHVTSIFVTHDQEEALELADRVVIMNKGKVEQCGTPDEVYGNPANAFVYHFLGNVNVFHGRMSGDRFLIHREGDDDAGGQRPAAGFVRPHEVEISLTPFPATDSMEAQLVSYRIQGGTMGLELRRIDGNGAIEAEIDRDSFYRLNLRKGSRLFARFRTIKVFTHDYQI